MALKWFQIDHNDSVSAITNRSVRGTITGATQANPCVVTCSAGHNFVNNDAVIIRSVGGMTQLNDNYYVVDNVSGTTFELQGIDSTAFGAYTTGGVADRYFGTIQTGRSIVLIYQDTAKKPDIIDAINRAKEKAIQLL